MKKLLLTIAIGTLPAIMMLEMSVAQGTSAKESATKPGSSFHLNLPASNDKAAKNFKRKFKNVTNPTWETVSDGTIATFNYDGVITKVFYNNNGNWQHTISYYGESKLPGDVRSQVKSQYFDYNISQVEELTLPTQIIYLVHIDGSSDRKVLRISGGELQEMVVTRN
ncbi:MAG: hypothetical protein C5B52_11190 [Bacteroidetes bacterium]|nr:MAG: hypothetical protein C5B52_11190 [Bacteroidota bacterium]